MACRQTRAGGGKPEDTEVVATSFVGRETPSLEVVEARDGPAETIFKCQSPATFDGGSWLKSILLSLLFVIVPLFEIKMSGSMARIFVQNDETLTVDRSQTEPYFEVKILNLYSTKNDFQWYIICLCLEAFAKIHVFQEKLWKMLV